MPAEPDGSNAAEESFDAARILPYVIAGAVLVAIVLGGVLALPRLNAILHPLPRKRFVALMEWPPSADRQYRPLVARLLDTVEKRLARAEAGHNDLLAISAGDVEGQAPLSAPAEAAGALGANLALAASARPAGNGVVVSLKLIDTATSKVLRETEVKGTSGDLDRIPETGAAAAAGLLDVSGAAGAAPDASQVLLAKARDLHGQGRRVEEVEAWRQLLLQRPNYWPAHLEMGKALQEEGKNDKAAQAFTEGSVIAPRAVPLLNHLAEMYLLMDRRPEAEYALSRSIERGPSEFAYTSLGKMAFTAGDYRKALDYFQKARDLAPSRHTVWRNLGDCYGVLAEPGQKDESYRRAAELLQASLNADPAPGGGWMTLAFYQAKLGLRAEAEKSVSLAESHGASDLRSQFQKAQVMALLGKKDDALRLVLDCIAKGLPRAEIELALDLRDVRSDPRYQ